LLLGKRHPNSSTLVKLYMAGSRLRRSERDEAEQTRNMLEDVRRHCKRSGLRHFAKRAGIDPANLNSVLKSRRKPSPLMLAKLEAALAPFS
jgi:hypothetical protein